MNAQQLKNSILQEAIEGRLVPQDPNDEPASVLLEKIREEKARLVKEGKLKKKDLVETPISEDEIPFEIPKSWKWVKIKSIFSMQAGKNVTAADISSEQNNIFKYPCFGGNGLRGYVKNYNTEGEFPLIGRQGALCGNVNMASGKFWATEHAVVTDGFNMTNVKWQYYFLIALNLNRYATATAQPGLAVSNIIEAPIPLPPLAEQKRIIAKIEELLPKIEEYGKAQESLNKLNEELPERLKKSILQEAIEGRLVPQDPNDEPASVLLEIIRKEKAKFVKERILKKKDLDEKKSLEDYISFKIPKTWEWVKVFDCVDIIYGYPFDSNLFNEIGEGYPLIRIRDILPSNSNTYTTEKADERYIIRKGDMLVGMDGNFNVRFWNSIPAYLNQRVCKIKAKEHILSQKFLYYYLPIALDNIFKSVSYVTVKHLSDKHLRNIIIPLPPLSEQHRIVAKIEQLFSEIEKLKV